MDYFKWIIMSLFSKHENHLFLAFPSNKTMLLSLNHIFCVFQFIISICLRPLIVLKIDKVQ